MVMGKLMDDDTVNSTHPALDSRINDEFYHKYQRSTCESCHPSVSLQLGSLINFPPYITYSLRCALVATAERPTRTAPTTGEPTSPRKEEIMSASLSFSLLLKWEF